MKKLFYFVFLVFIISCNSNNSKQSVYKAPGVVQKQKEMQTSFAVADYRGYVSDYENIYTPDQQVILSNLISNYEKKTGVEFAILTIPEYESDISDYTVQTFKKWGIGKKGINNGLLLVISKNQHKFYACTGYGLEGYLPDGWLKITEQNCFPTHFQAGEYFEGTKEFITACINKIGNVYSKDDNKTKLSIKQKDPGLPIYIWIVIVIAFVLFIGLIIIIIKSVSDGTFGNGCSSGGFGGRFGGGDSGGGDSSFGGFGGGDTGGGGAGGSW